MNINVQIAVRTIDNGVIVRCEDFNSIDGYSEVFCSSVEAIMAVIERCVESSAKANEEMKQEEE